MKNYKILVVDDEAELTEIMAEALEMEDFECLKSFDGDQAIELFQKGGVHCVLSDSNMPGMKGVELLEKLKEYGSPGETFLFYLCTGEIGLKEDQLHAMGIKRLLTKPYDLFSLSSIIRKDLDDHFSC